MTEALLALLAAGICAMLLHQVMADSQALADRVPEVQNGLGLLQLRQRAAQAATLDCDGNDLVMIRAHQEYRYAVRDGRVVQTPGYEIILEPVKEGRFACEEGQVWLETETGRWQVR